MAPALNGDAADLLVVGAGAAGMTAALVAALEGRRVILAEATQQVGGTTSTSAGTLWVPGNPHAARAGHGDTVQQAATYLRALLGPDDDARGRRQAFLDTTAEALAYLEERSSVVFASAGKHPDYLPQPGAAIAGRAVGPLPFDGRTLGADFARIRPPLPGFMLLGGMMVGKADIQALVGRYGSWKDFLHSARLVARYAADRLRHPRGTRLVMGNALVARLFQSLLAAKVDVRFGWRLRDLEVHEGRVVGASFDQADGAVRHVAAPAVVLATGGVGHQAALRRELVPDGDSFRSLAAESVRGDGMLAARRAGAAIERHALGNLLWQPVSVVPGTSTAGGLFPHLFLDRAKPGLIAVNVAGRRFVDESLSYHHFVEGLLPQGRAWLVCDAAFVRRYGLGVIPPGTRRLGRWVRNGYIACEPTLAALGRRVGIDASGLAATVARTNGFADTGSDLDHGPAPQDLPCARRRVRPAARGAACHRAAARRALQQQGGAARHGPGRARAEGRRRSVRAVPHAGSASAPICVEADRHAAQWCAAGGRGGVCNAVPESKSRRVRIREGDAGAGIRRGRTTPVGAAVSGRARACANSPNS